MDSDRFLSDEEEVKGGEMMEEEEEEEETGKELEVEEVTDVESIKCR